MKKNGKKTLIASLSVVAVLLASALLATCTGTKEVTLDTTQAKTGTIEVTVMATGYVQPVDQVDIGTQVSGIVEKIYVDFNSQVKKNQLLAELDKSTLSEKLSQADASLKSATSERTYARQNYDRVKLLYDAKAATEVAYEEAVNRLAQAETSVTNAQANLHQAKVNLSYADITSPIDGIVLNRAVEQGQTVAASFSTPTLFTIANDLTKMQVEADVDEADIGKIVNGQQVEFTVDAYANDVFNGTVSQIRIQPTVTNNVVTYTVIIEAPNPDEKLFPGMTANINIKVQSAEGIVIPREAVAYAMSQDIMEQLGISQTEGTAPGNSKGSSVWIKTPSGTVEKRQIATGSSDGVEVIAVSGLSDGEEVVISANLGKTAKKETASANPLMPSPPKGSGGGPR